MNRRKANAILLRLRKAIPNPKTELAYRSAYELLIAAMLSAQSTDKGVNKATPTLFKIANTPQTMVTLGEKKLKTYIKTIGLYNVKAANIIKMSQLLIDNFKGRVPNKLEELESLPGVGRKTANVILNVIFKEPVIAVDTHVFRVANRTKIAVGKTPAEVEQLLYKILDKKFWLQAHYLLVLHGRYTCTAKKPLCASCPIYELCEWEDKPKFRP
jgi:endonuclease III